MSYAYRGSGYLADAVQGTGTPSYLYVKSGYSGGTNFLGYEGFGTRVLADGGIIESYSCVANEINTSPSTT